MSYIHSVPGRLRVQTPKLRYATCQAAELKQALDDLHGIYQHRFNQKAGSFLVEYDPKELAAEDILYLMHRSGCLEGNWSQLASAKSHGLVSQVGTSLGVALFGTLMKKGIETSIHSITKALF